MPLLDNSKDGEHPTAMLIAMLIGAVARNEVEELHREHIPDEEMPTLNRAIRNAAYTVLQAVRSMDHLPKAEAWVRYQLQFVPRYWEPPELLRGYADAIDPSNQWLAALLRGDLAPAITSAASFDRTSVEELAAEWAAAFAARFPRAPAACAGLERDGHYAETARRAKAWRREHADASLQELTTAVTKIYEQVIAPLGRDERGQPIMPGGTFPPTRPM